jgi:hypothetical protein
MISSLSIITGYQKMIALAGSQVATSKNNAFPGYFPLHLALSKSFAGFPAQSRAFHGVEIMLAG